jgi:hypothetical protein
LKKLAYFILIIIFSAVLNIYFAEDEQVLGGGYYYLPPYEALDIGYPNGPIIYKSFSKNCFEDIIIKEKVISVQKNRDFIIAIQEKVDTNNLKIVNKKSVSNYFIIAKKTNNVYGPFNYEEYLQERLKLKIPSSLVLEN